jgi:glycosyltransferase involved in cell wall biosynthesis
VVTVVSEATKKDLLKYVRCKPEKIKVIPSFVSSRFKAFPKTFDLKKLTILHIGTAPNKNLERLIMAIAGISCHLYLIGKLSKAQFFLLKKYNIDFTNKFNTSDEEVLEAFRVCDLVCFVSTLEGFGVPLLEAQATGRPVITGNLSAMPEVAGGGALFVNPFDVNSIREGIICIISNAELRNRLIEAGFENVKRFPLATTVNGYLEVYLKLLDRNA